MWHSQVMEYYANHQVEWSTDQPYNIDEPWNIKLGGRSQITKDHIAWSHLYEMYRVDKSIEMVSRLVIARGWECVVWKSLSGYGTSLFALSSAVLWACWIIFPWPGIESVPLQWKHGVLFHLTCQKPPKLLLGVIKCSKIDCGKNRATLWTY